MFATLSRISPELSSLVEGAGWNGERVRRATGAAADGKWTLADDRKRNG